MRFTKENIDKNYQEIESYMKKKAYHDMIGSYIRLLFFISQSEEAGNVREFFSGRELPIVESFHDLDASVELAKLGFFKQAVASLRMGLDNGLLSAYWNVVGYDTPEFRRWIHSKENTPRRDARFWTPIRQLPGVERFYESFSFENTINTVSRQLNDYVHTKGFLYSTWGEFQRTIRTQNANVDCDTWYEMFVGTTRVVVTLQLLVRPKLAIVVPDEYLLRKFGSHDEMPFCGVLFGDYSDQIRLCVGKAEYSEISTIADTTPEVEDVWTYLESCPDLKDDEIRKINYKFWKSSGLDDETAGSYVAETLRSVREYEAKQRA